MPASTHYQGGGRGQVHYNLLEEEKISGEVVDISTFTFCSISASSETGPMVATIFARGGFLFHVYTDRDGTTVAWSGGARATSKRVKWQRIAPRVKKPPERSILPFL
jgi:hypothetical protein